MLDRLPKALLLLLSYVDACQAQILLRLGQLLLCIRLMAPRIRQLELLILLRLAQRIQRQSQALVERRLLLCPRLSEALLPINLLLRDLVGELLKLHADPRGDRRLEEHALLVLLDFTLQIPTLLLQLLQPFLLALLKGLLLLCNELVEHRLPVQS